MSGELKIEILSDVDTEVFERLEDSIRDLLEREGLVGIIEDFKTGNITRTRDEMMRKNGCTSPDQNIRGILVLGEKIWFNDDLRCRLRICGFSKEQQEKLRKAKLIDLTLTDNKGNDANVSIDISEFPKIK